MVNMLISPSQATVKAGFPESVATKRIVPATGAGAIAANAVAVANMAATKRKREETPVVEERTVFCSSRHRGVGSKLYLFQTS